MQNLKQSALKIINTQLNELKQEAVFMIVLCELYGKII